MKKAILFLLALSLLLTLPVFAVNAAETEAQDLTKEATKTVKGLSSTGFLYDGNRRVCKNTDGNLTVTLEHEAGFGSLYLILGKAYGEYTITDDTSDFKLFFC